MNTNYIAVGAALVSIFGLVSCGRDANKQSEPTPEPVIIYVEDKWTLSHPLLLKDGETLESNVEPRDLVKNSTDPIPANARIAFASLKADIAEGTEVSSKFEVTCSFEGHTSSETLEFPQQFEFPIRSLLPAEYLANPDREDSSSIVCSIKITANNKLGSTHTVSISNVVFHELKSLENLKLQSSSSTQNEIKYITPRSLTTPSLRATNPTRLRANLVCDHFRNERPVENPNDLVSVFADLLSGPQQPKLHGIDQQGYDLRSTYTQQKCRLFMEGLEKGRASSNSSSDYSGPYRWLSGTFIVRFPPPPLEISGSWGMRDVYFDTFNGQLVFRYVIKNPSNVPVGLRAQLLGKAALVLRHTDRFPDGSFVSSVEHTFNLITTLTGASPVSQQNEFQVFEILPGQTVEIISRLDASIFSSCQNLVRPMANTRGLPYLVGFKFRFPKPFRLERFLNWDSKQSTTGSSIDVTPEEMVNFEQRGWFRHAEWTPVSFGEFVPGGTVLTEPGIPGYCLRPGFGSEPGYFW